MIHPHVVPTLIVVCTITTLYASVFRTTLAIHMKDADRNVLEIANARQTRLVSNLDVKIHALECVALKLFVQ